MTNDEMAPTQIPTRLNVTALAKRLHLDRRTVQRRLAKGWVPPARKAKPRKTPQPTAASVPHQTPHPDHGNSITPETLLTALTATASTPHEAPRHTGTSAGAANVMAYMAAVALAATAAYFSVGGMAEIFAGSAVAVMVLAGTMEATKLVIAVGWLATGDRLAACCAPC